MNNYKQNEIVWLSVLQGFAMFLVVLGHILLGKAVFEWQNILFEIIYSFHMPLFICISGYLFHTTQIQKNKSFTLMLKNKAIRLCVPYFSLTFLFIILKVALSEYTSTKMEFSINRLLDIFVWLNNPFIGMWFLNTLFGLFLLYPIYRFANKNSLFTLLLFISFFALHFTKFSIPSFVLNFRNIISYAVFFYAGVLLSRFNFGRNWSIKSNIFSSFRDYSYQIYLLSIFPQIFVSIVVNRYFEVGITQVFILYSTSIVLGLYIPVLISRITQKLNLKVFKILIGLR